ncbi:MAG: hypothetical protein ACO1SV_05000 [Fimbriimonas sp.]
MEKSAAPPDDLWVRFALEQAKILASHLEHGSVNPDFVRIHALTLFQIAEDACLVEEGESRGQRPRAA